MSTGVSACPYTQKREDIRKLVLTSDPKTLGSLYVL